MKTRYTLLCIAILTLTQLNAQQQQGMVAGTSNYTSFSSIPNVLDNEVLQYNKGFESHPEIGMLFAGTPCEDCFEVIEKRTETTKYFVKKGTDGTYIYQQTAIDPMHIKDENGNFKTVIATLNQVPSMPGVYSADQQPVPVGVNSTNNFSYIGKHNKRFYFNRNLTLVFVPDGGQEQVVGAIDWSNHTAGNDGVYVTDAWPGIDMEIIVYRGQLKTNYKIKNPLPQFANGHLRIRDRLNTDEGLSIHTSGEKSFNGPIEIVDESANAYYIMDPAVVYDNNVKNDGKTGLNYELNGMQLDIIVPQAWINRDASTYPVVIDPLVSATTNMAIAGSGYNATCFTGGCIYNLAVPVPAAITITDIRFSFSYNAINPCWLNDGAMDFNLGACRSPAAPGFFWFCNLASPGLCTGTNISILADVAACVPPPSCPTYNMNFTMHFYRCFSAGGGCSNTCIGAATPWTMVVEGRTVQTVGNVSVLPPVTICQGASTTLSVNGQYGVAPYNYTWNPGGLPGSPSVSPAATTTYTVTITDACGSTITATKVVNVTLNNNPGFNITPNPACIGQLVNVAGLGGGAPGNYDWLLPSSSSPAINNTQVVNVTYAAAGTYNITLNYANGACVFPLVQTVTINPPVLPTINIVAAPAGAICAGTNVTFTANITGGGITPSYQWQVNGANVGANSNTYSTTTLNNGDIVTCILTSNDPCASPVNVTSNSIVMVVNPVLLPTINIVAAPAGPICAGTNVTFTANITNGGPTPAYQWQVNGANVGANINTYSNSALVNGDIITCILTSNDPCASPTNVTSNSIVMVVNPVLVPTINIVAVPAGPICSGTNVTFTANITNGGAGPSYQWQVNGGNVGGNSATYSNAGLNNGDVVTCILTSNATCASPTNVTSNSIIMTVIPTVIPTINIVAVPAGPICAGTNVTFTANITNGGATPAYQWQINGGNVGANSNTFSSSTLNNGDVVTCILTSNAPCATPANVTSANIVMTVNPLLTPTINIVSVPVMPICAGSNVTFTANITNGGAGPSYQWQVNGVNAGPNASTFTTNTLVPGDIVTCTLTSNATCLAVITANSNNIVVSNFPPVSLTVSPDVSICFQDIITLTATPSSGNPALYDVVWQPNNVNGNSTTLSPNATTTYTATVTDACGSTASATVTVTVNPQPVASFTFAPDPPDLTAQPTQFTDASINAGSWFWNFGNGDTSNAQNPTFEFTMGGTYPIILIVTSPFGCTDTTISYLIIEEIYSLFVPSAFTPNLDEINPIFYAYGFGMKSFKMEIFERWGESIFTTTDLTKGWEGLLKNGNPAPVGVYTYMVEVEFHNHKTRTVMGKVTLIR